MLERLHQARTLFESVFHNTRPPEPVAALADGPADIDTLDIREPGAFDAAWGNGAH